MNWEAIGAVGQMVGSIAVFITLGYLAVQVRHARLTGQRALSQGRSEALRDLLTQQTDERMIRLALKTNAGLGGQSTPFVRALMDQTGVTEEEAMLVMWSQITWWNYFLQIIPHVKELPPMERRQFDVPLRSYGRPGPFRLFYEHYIRQLGHPDAIAYIENLLAQPG